MFVFYFGSVFYFQDIDAASRFLTLYKATLRENGYDILISSHNEVYHGVMQNRQKNINPSRILLISLDGQKRHKLKLRAIDIAAMVHPHAHVLKVIVFKRGNGHQALVQVANVQQATLAAQHLHGSICDFVSDPLKVEFSTDLKDLDIDRDCDSKRDFTRSVTSTTALTVTASSPFNSPSPSLIGGQNSCLTVSPPLGGGCTSNSNNSNFLIPLLVPPPPPPPALPMGSHNVNNTQIHPNMNLINQQVENNAVYNNNRSSDTHSQKNGNINFISNNHHQNSNLNNNSSFAHHHNHHQKQQQVIHNAPSRNNHNMHMTLNNPNIALSSKDIKINNNDSSSNNNNYLHNKQTALNIQAPTAPLFYGNPAAAAAVNTTMHAAQLLNSFRVASSLYTQPSFAAPQTPGTAFGLLPPQMFASSNLTNAPPPSHSTTANTPGIGLGTSTTNPAFAFFPMVDLTNSNNNNNNTTGNISGGNNFSSSPFSMNTLNNFQAQQQMLAMQQQWMMNNVSAAAAASNQAHNAKNTNNNTTMSNCNRRPSVDLLQNMNQNTMKNKNNMHNQQLIANPQMMMQSIQQQQQQQLLYTPYAHHQQQNSNILNSTRVKSNRTSSDSNPSSLMNNSNSSA